MTGMTREQLVAAMEHHDADVRPCVVDCVDHKLEAVCHRLYVRQWTHGEAITVGGFPAGQESEAFALVEYDDGELDTVPARSVRFTDRGDSE